MKYILATLAGVFALGSVAVADTIDFADSFVELNTNLNGTNNLTLGSAVTLGNVSSTYAEGTITNSGAGNDFSVGLGQEVRLGALDFDVTGTYTWGASGGDIVGFGDNNEWGDLDLRGEFVLAPNALQGGYVFTGVDLAVDGILDFEWTGGDIGAGFQWDFTEQTYLDANVSWGYDSDFDFTERQVQVGVGFRF